MRSDDLLGGHVHAQSSLLPVYGIPRLQPRLQVADNIRHSVALPARSNTHVLSPAPAPITLAWLPPALATHL